MPNTSLSSQLLKIQSFLFLNQSIHLFSLSLQILLSPLHLFHFNSNDIVNGISHMIPFTAIEDEDSFGTKFSTIDNLWRQAVPLESDCIKFCQCASLLSLLCKLISYICSIVF